ncbi:MAG: putative toxin-antitoxin system toxin component, PIN family [Candidatus Omnitrophota bacterium]
MKIFFDTNVLISAFIANGTCHEVVHDSISRHDLYYSDFIVNEFSKVLKDSFKFSEQSLKELTLFIERFFIKGSTAGFIEDICNDKNDNQLLADSVFNNIDIMITGDKELLHLKSYKCIKIISPSEYWKL